MIPENYGIDNTLYYCEVGKEDEMKQISNKGFQEIPTIKLINEEEISKTTHSLKNLCSTINKITKIRLSKLASIKLKELFCMPIDYKKLVNRRKKFGERRNMRWK